MVSGNIVWQHSEEGVGTTTQIPAWSPLGDQVAVVVGNHLFRVSRSGLATPLPDIGEDEIRRFSWSPDGSHIAFLASAHHWETRRLFILDTTGNQVIDLCLDTTMAGGYPPLWSPDGLQFTFSRAVEYADGSEVGEDIVVDIDKGRANLIPDDEAPSAWMRSVP
jgi:dipeptidyl aminopeptidase/acylaminoacyl peptidase